MPSDRHLPDPRLGRLLNHKPPAQLTRLLGPSREEALCLSSVPTRILEIPTCTFLSPQPLTDTVQQINKALLVRKVEVQIMTLFVHNKL